MVYEQYKAEIDRYLAENAQAFLDDLDAFLSIPSVSDDKEAVAAALHWCLDKAREMGLHASAYVDNQVGIISFGEGDECVGMLAHVDVVTAGDASDWRFPPYAATVAEGKVWGRGAVDDKGPLLNCLYAMKAVAALGIKPLKRVELILGTQEEVSWTDMTAFLDYCEATGHRLPDYAFTPDGEYPIGNREKGYADVKLSFPVDKCEVCDDVSDDCIAIQSLSGGPTINSVPSTARTMLCGDLGFVEKALAAYLLEHPLKKIAALAIAPGRVEVEARGVAIHSSFPEKGVNAIWELAGFLGTLPLEGNGVEKTIAFINDISCGDFVGAPFGLDRGMVTVNGEDMHRTMMAITQIETHAEKVVLNYNVRQTYGVTRSDLMEGFALYAGEYHYEVDICDFMEALYVDSNRPFIKAMASIYEDNTPWKSHFNLGHGSSYAKALPNTVYWGPVFPNESDPSHEANENVLLENLHLSTRLFAYYLAELVFSEQSFL